MARETLETRGINSIVWGSDRPVHITTMEANGTDIYPGVCVTATGETYPNIDLCGASSAGEIPLGIVMNDVSGELDKDTVYPDGAGTANVPVLTIGRNPGLGVYAFFKESPGALVFGMFCTYEDSTGDLETFAVGVSASTSIEDTMAIVVGRIWEARADNAAAKLTKIRLGV